jgi:hypothetical protein
MTMRKLLLGLAALAVATTAGAFGPAERRAKELAAYQPVGEPVSCISLNQIRSTRILANNVIDFKMTGGKHFRNTLPHSCPSLVSEDRFLYKTSLNQLCHVDTIRVLYSAGGTLQEGAGCGLGKFQPMEKVPTTEPASYVEGEWAPFEVVEGIAASATN